MPFLVKAPHFTVGTISDAFQAQNFTLYSAANLMLSLQAAMTLHPKERALRDEL